MKLAINVAAMLIAFIALVAMVNFVFGLPAYLHNSAQWTEALEGFHRMTIDLPEGCDTARDAGTLASCIRQANELGVTQSPLEAWEPLSLQRLLGWVFWPIAVVMGVPIADCQTVATLLGEKTVLNEFVAFLHLGQNLESAHPISPRAAVITSYALCGFANFGSIAIQIGGIGAMAPERRADLARLGLRAMIGGMLASNMTACIAGVLL